MSDLTPPPDEPMTEQTRARIRADLLASTRGQGPSRASRWVVPGVAAAAVVLVAGMAAWAVQVGGDDGTSGPSAGGSSSAPPSDESTVVATTKPGRVTGSVPPENAVEPATSCGDELAEVLPGAEQAAAFPDGTSFLVKGDRFVLCDVRAGTTTVHHPVSTTPGEGVEPFRVSSLYAPEKGGGFRTIRVAGGLVPEGMTAFDVRYTFPDGHTEAATTIDDDQGRTWWRMLYAYDDGGGNEMEEQPIRVTVGYSGVQRTYDLQWGIDTCAQANHGC